MLFCKLEGVSFEISKKLKFSVEPFFYEVINDVIGAILFFFFSKVGHVIYRWKGCLKLITIRIRNMGRKSCGEEICAHFLLSRDQNYGFPVVQVTVLLHQK